MTYEMRDPSVERSHDGKQKVEARDLSTRKSRLSHVLEENRHQTRTRVPNPLSYRQQFLSYTKYEALILLRSPGIDNYVFGYLAVHKFHQPMPLLPFTNLMSPVVPNLLIKGRVGYSEHFFLFLSLQI